MNTYLMPGLTFGPKVVRRLLEHIPETRLDEPSAAGRFSPREVVAHLADWEPILLERLKTGVLHPGAPILVHDEGKRAVEQGYAHSDVNERLDKWAACRNLTIKYLETLKDDEWANRFVHPERGPMTVADQANLLLGHDLYHIEQLSAYLGDKVASVW